MHTTKLLIFAIILCTLLIEFIAAKNEFELQFENFTCKSNSHLLKRFNCGLSKNPKRRNLQMEFALLETLNEHEFFIEIVMPRPTEDFVLLNLTIDGCQLLANRKQVPLMRIAREILDRYSNFPSQCPFEKNKSYYIRGFRLDLSLIAAAVVETPMKLRFIYQRKELQLLEGHIQGRLQRKNTDV